MSGGRRCCNAAFCAMVRDSWRKRYHSLALHNSIHLNHLPYMEFPPTWPKYIPKDMLGNWFEFYADAIPSNIPAEQRYVTRQALAGMFWSKQFYDYDVTVWLREHGVDPYNNARPSTSATPTGTTW